MILFYLGGGTEEGIREIQENYRRFKEKGGKRTLNKKRKSTKWVPEEIYQEWIKYRPIANVNIAVINSQNQLLLLKRLMGKTKGEWELPAGAIEKDELLKESACRELKEETGIKASPNQLLQLTTVEAFHPNDRTDIATPFLLRISRKTIKVKISTEHSGYSWILLDKAYIYQMNEATYQMNEATKRVIREIYDYSSSRGRI